MKSKIFRITLVAFFLGSFSLINAQTNNNMTPEQRAELRSASKTNVSKSDNQSNVDINDGYFGKKEKILSKLKVKEIPASFPKYDGKISEEAYKEKMKDWCRDNKDLLREEFKQKFERREASNK